MCNTMRTSILSAAIFGLFAAGCAGDLSGTGDDPGDDTPGAECGNSIIDQGETCDDGNSASGDGCSSSCSTEQSSTPRVAINADKTTLTTDMLVSNEINLTLTSMGGFAGDVALAASAVDGTGATVEGWSATLSAPTVTLTADGTGTAKVTLRVMGDTPTATASLKISATSTVDPVEAAVAVTANPVVKVTYTTTANNCAYPTEFGLNNPIRVKVGRQLSIVNGSDPAGTGCGGSPCRMTIHMDPGITGISHQQGLMAPGAAYTQTVGSASETGITFYCHDAGALADQALDTSPMQTRQRLISVP
jgi:cysteine-rich repeat protein